jgi:serine/threonine protein kinase
VSATTRKSIAGFEIESTVGEGGMGIVYLARQPDLDRRVVRSPGARSARRG